MNWLQFGFELAKDILTPTDLNPGEDQYFSGYNQGYDQGSHAHDHTSQFGSGHDVANSHHTDHSTHDHSATHDNSAW
jgi:hypothetical protein